uniref:PH-like domain-containing protein n=1 Tax=Panagrolaimus davidi TaxID=227884 RepID=A0A914PSF0_9BILA
MTYYCRIIFKSFNSDQVDEFVNHCNEYKWETITSFNILEGENRIIGNEVDLFDEKLEKKFSFQLIPDKNGEKSDKYEKITLAFCELTMNFKRFEEILRTEHRSIAMTAILTSISKDISPQRFEQVLQNIFCLSKIALGSIHQKHYFAATYLHRAPEEPTEVFQKFLTEYRGIEPEGSNMLAIFEHDRDSLVVAFPDTFEVRNIMTAEGERESVKTGNRIIELRMKYSSIRRIIVSLDYNEEDGITATFTLQFRYPPMVYIWDEFKGKDDENAKFRNGQRWLSWRGKSVEVALARASCLVLEAFNVEGRVLMDCLDRLRKNIDSPIEFRFLYWKAVNFDGKKRTVINPSYYENINFFSELDKHPNFKHLSDPKYFPLIYAIEALISHGGELYDCFFRPPYGCFIKFMYKVVQCYEYELEKYPDSKYTRTVATLENMVQQMHGVS